MKKTIKFSKFIRSKTTRVLMTLIMIACLSLSLSYHINFNGALKAHAASPKYGTMTVWKWDRLYSMDSSFKEDFYGLIIYDDGGNTWFSSGASGRDKTHWTSKNINTDPYICSKASTFYTRTRLDSPYFTYKGSDGDNKDCRKYYLTLYSGDSSQARLNYTHFDIKRDWDDDQISIIDRDKLRAKAGITMNSGEFQMFFNTSGNDTVIFGRSGEFYGDGSGGEWPGTRFRIYKGTKTTYSCLNNNFTIDPDQVLIVDSNVVITEDATLTVPEGAVLVVKKGALFVNGSLEVKGGTVLVEDGGIIMPFESKKKGCNIALYEGGTLIIRSGGKVYAGCPKDKLVTGADGAYFDAYSGSTIINYGLLAVGKTYFLDGSLVENHKNAKMYLGYVLNNVDKFFDTATNASGVSSGDYGLESDSSLCIAMKSSVISYSGGIFSCVGNLASMNYKYHYYDNGKITDYTIKP